MSREELFDAIALAIEDPSQDDEQLWIAVSDFTRIRPPMSAWEQFLLFKYRTLYE